VKTFRERHIVIICVAATTMSFGFLIMSSELMVTESWAKMPIGSALTTARVISLNI